MLPCSVAVDNDYSSFILFYFYHHFFSVLFLLNYRHAALDAVDELVWERSELHMKHIDRFNTWIVTAYVTPSRVRLMLLHDVRNDDGIKTFLTEVRTLNE